MKVIRIESCEECPNIDTRWDDEAGTSIWVCDHHALCEAEPIEDTESIPRWCPLPDDEGGKA